MLTWRSGPEERSVAQAIEIRADKFSVNTTQFNATNAPNGTLAPISPSTMNRSQTTPSLGHSTKSSIRAVPPEPLQFNTLDDGRRNPRQSEAPSLLPTRALSPFDFPFSSSPGSPPIANGIVKTISSEFGPSRTYNQIPTSEDTFGSRSTSPGSSQWSSAVGRASQGKSGRVIERLMTENDMLKRDLKIQEISTENAREEKKLDEEKQRALSNELDSVLHDAVITKTLLKKRDRQFVELQAQVDAEKAKTEAAQVRERGWKEEMERVVTESKAAVQRTVEETNAKIERSLVECKSKVDEAQQHSALMDGRVKVMEDYWKETNQLVSNTASCLSEEIERVMLQRREDLAKRKLLEDLCDQKNSELKQLHKDHDEVLALHEAYKAEQEDALRSIKERAAAQERESEVLVDKSKKVLGELQWALAVQQNVRTE